VVDGDLQVYTGRQGGADRLLYFGRKTTEQVTLDLTFGRNGYKVSLVPTDDDRLVFEAESCWGRGWQYTRPYSVSLGSGHEESALPAEVEAKRGDISPIVLSTIQSWVVYHFHDTGPKAPAKRLGDVDDNEALRPDARNLAALLYLLHQTRRERYDQIVETVRLAAPFFRGFRLRPSRLNRDKIKLEWRHRGSDAYFDASSLSDGTLRFICLATLLLQPRLEDTESTLIIDEPELGLHPYAITLLASMLREAATRSTVIVSTQSASLVNQFEPEDVIVVDREDEASTFRRLSEDDLAHWLQDYGLGDLWEKNVIGGRPTR
jgi:predicted ATPase